MLMRTAFRHLAPTILSAAATNGKLTSLLPPGESTWWKMDARLSMSTLMTEFEQEMKALGVKVDGGDGRIRLDKHVDKGLAIITLDNPHKKNALSGKMILELGAIVDELEQWEEGKGLILWGGPNMFCAGADLNMVDKLSRSSTSGLKLSQIMQNLLTRLLDLPLLSLALVTGKALGGGTELLTATDFRLLASDAEIQCLHLRMGVVPGWGGAVRLGRLVGRTCALDLLTSCRRVTAEEALRIGLAEEVLAPSGSEQCLEEAKRWLLKRINAAPEVVRAMKSVVSRTTDAATYEEALRAEREVFGSVWGGPALLQALESFKTKL